MKRIFSVFLILCIMLSSLFICSVSTSASTSGTLGSCTWTLDGSNLTISGSGAINLSGQAAPWGTNITSLTVSEGITSISVQTFLNCAKLTKVSLPSTLTSIGNSAFAGCESLTAISIPESVTSIGHSAFSGCYGLTNITIPKNVSYIGDGVFGDCFELKKIPVDDENAYYTDVGGVLFTKDMSVLLRYPMAKNGSTYSVPQEVRKIAIGAFDGVWELTDVELHDDITEIGLNAFFGTEMLRNDKNVSGGCVYIDNHLILVDNKDITTCKLKKGTKTIAEGAFISCDKLTKVTLSEELTYISPNAFAWCSALKTIYIPKALVKICNDAFYDCKLTNVYYGGSAQDKAKLTIDNKESNSGLVNASWTLNACLGGNEHSWSDVEIIKEASCSEPGKKRAVCTVCSHEDTVTIKRLEHTYGDWVVESEATCNKEGVEKRACSVCDKSQQRKIDLAEHSFGEWKTVNEPTQSEAGLAKAVCTVCGVEQTKELPAGTKVEDDGGCNSSISLAVPLLATLTLGGALLKKRRKK